MPEGGKRCQEGNNKRVGHRRQKISMHSENKIPYMLEINASKGSLGSPGESMHESFVRTPWTPETGLMDTAALRKAPPTSINIEAIASLLSLSLLAFLPPLTPNLLYPHQVTLNSRNLTALPLLCPSTSHH